jgi:hypothetical protein
MELTSEMIAEALGYETIVGYSITKQSHGCLMWRCIERGNDDEWYDCPDFLHDNNASWKYLALKMPSHAVLKAVLESWTNGSSLSMNLATEFMKLKGGE